MAGYYDRYKKYRSDGEVQLMPFVKINVDGGDLTIIYDKSKMRFDNLSYKYYGDPNYGWLILQANPQYGGYEFSIPDGVELRIPYPLQTALTRYESQIARLKSEEGDMNIRT